MGATTSKTMGQMVYKWKTKLPSSIIIHPDGQSDGVLPGAVVSYLEETLSIAAAAPEIKAAAPFFPTRLAGKSEDFAANVAARLVRARVTDPAKPPGTGQILPAELNYEIRRLTDPEHKSFGILYDARRLMEVYSSLMDEAEGDERACNVIVTNQLIGSMAFPEKRYHARVGWFSFPSIISVPGVSLAPARSREYHLAQRIGIRGPVTDDDHIASGDTRVNDVLKGLALQALFFNIGGDPFCEDKNCRLFNAHTQAEMIHAQTRPDAGLCDIHLELLKVLDV